MLTYYLQTAARSLRSARTLSLLMLLALGMGIGACMTTISVYHVLGGDPIPDKSDRLFNVELDAADLVGYHPGDEPTFQLTRDDAEALLRGHRAKRQVMMSGTGMPVQPLGSSERPFFVDGRFASTDFFAMFEVPFRYGSGWSAQDDADQARVVVLSRSLNERLFGGANSVGRELQVRGVTMRVVGVLADWRPVPQYFDTTRDLAQIEDLYLPFGTAMALHFDGSGNTTCWSDLRGKSPRDLGAPCAWVQYWVELASPAEAGSYRDYLRAYSDAQRRAGRFQRPTNVRLRNVMDWLAFRHALPGDVRLQTALGFGFLAVCLVNTVGLLLAKTLRRAPEIGVRRALGATRAAIFAQFLVEAGALGLAGGVLGLALAWGGLWLVRHSPTPYAPAARLDATMLGLTLALALLASLIAGVLPAWQAARVTPAQQLKTQ